MELIEGRVIAGKFRLERRIGQGAMGEVWGARHLALDAPVALKFMSPELVASAQAVARFEREAVAAARLRSPHVVQVLDHGVDEGTPFIAMEWLEGEDLAHRLRRLGRLSLREASAVATQVAKALSAAQREGIVHRDLKPSNVFLASVHGEEIVKLLDFGVAKVRSPDGEPSAAATATGALVGTPHYMSPEQIKGSKDVDHRSDVWSLGVILYHAITGRMPFTGDTMGDVLVKVCTQPLEPPTCVVFDLAPAVDWFFQRACARDPAQRYQTATELAAAFAALAEGRAAPGALGPAAQGAGAQRPRGGSVYFVPNPSPAPRKGTPMWVILFALLMVLVLALAFGQVFERAVKTIMEGI
ncbi:MAG: serine/threonine protein kinase [Polyangiaceae bacterium]|nr:serine/threonine protein kinase [Polyangiaceae bacterium]